MLPKVSCPHVSVSPCVGIIIVAFNIDSDSNDAQMNGHITYMNETSPAMRYDFDDGTLSCNY